MTSEYNEWYRSGLVGTYLKWREWRYFKPRRVRRRVRIRNWVFSFASTERRAELTAAGDLEDQRRRLGPIKLVFIGLWDLIGMVLTPVLAVWLFVKILPLVASTLAP